MVPQSRHSPLARTIGQSLSIALWVSLATLSTGREGDRETSPSASGTPPPNAELNTNTATPGKSEPAEEQSPAAPLPEGELFPVGSVDRPLVVRTFLPNLVENAALLPNHRPGAAATGYDPDTGRDTDTIIEPVPGLPAAIAVNFGDTLSIAWDTTECRWLYAWRGGFLKINDSDPLPELIGEIVYLAQGNSPLSMSIGAIAEQVKFYGYRSVDGVPEFLYTIGALKVAERIQPGEDGQTIVQHFNVERNPFDLMIAAPSAADRQSGGNGKDKKKASHSIRVINGKIEGDFAIVSKKDAADFTLVHSIGAPIKRPDTGTGTTLTIPLLAQNSKPPIKAKPVTLPPTTPTADPEPKTEPTSKVEPESKTMLVAEAKPASETKPEPAPQSIPKTKPAIRTEPAAPIISRARRYDRDILLTDPHIESGAMKKDSTAFSDRDFKFSELPDELVGADYVRTFDRDKYIPGDILSYRLELDSDASIYVLIDKRLDPMPKWVDKRFKDTGKTAALDAGRDFRVMRADADAGEFRFGPQDSGAGAHFYIIAATPRDTGSETESKK